MDSHVYDDILYMPRPVPVQRRRMSGLERAAQFAPFAALTGYDAAIAETARLTDGFVELGDCARADLDEKLRFLIDECPDHPALTVTYFLPDEAKEGGRYVTVSGAMKKLKLFERELVLADGAVIPLDAVWRLEGPCFSGLGE